jgi:hypothetical protein
MFSVIWHYREGFSFYELPLVMLLIFAALDR